MLNGLHVLSKGSKLGQKSRCQLCQCRYMWLQICCTPQVCSMVQDKAQYRNHLNTHALKDAMAMPLKLMSR